MKKRVQYLVGMLFSCSLLTFAPVAVVHAVATENSSSGTSTSSSGSTAQSDTTSTKNKSFSDDVKELTTTEGKKKLLADRLKERVDTLKIKLTAAEQANLKAKCAAAQTKVKTLDGVVDKGLVNRGKAYEELLSHVDKIITKLEDGDVDVTELKKQQTELTAKVELFKADLAKYKVALADLKEVGCVADPAAFKAALETARTARETVATDAKAIRTYVTDTIKPTLKTLRASVEKKTSTDDASGTSTQNSTTTTTNTTTGGAQ